MQSYTVEKSSINHYYYFIIIIIIIRFKKLWREWNMNMNNTVVNYSSFELIFKGVSNFTWLS